MPHLFEKLNTHTAFSGQLEEKKHGKNAGNGQNSGIGRCIAITITDNFRIYGNRQGLCACTVEHDR